MKANIGNYIVVFFVAGFVLTVLAFISFVFAFAYDEGQLDAYPLLGKVFTGIFVAFEYPSFQTHKLLGMGFPMGGRFFPLILVNIVLYSAMLSMLTVQIQQKIKRRKYK